MLEAAKGRIRKAVSQLCYAKEPVRGGMEVPRAVVLLEKEQDSWTEESQSQLIWTTMI